MNCPVCDCAPGVSDYLGTGYSQCFPCNVLLSFPWSSEEEYDEWYRNGGFHVDQQREEGFVPVADRYAEHFSAAHSRMEYYRIFIRRKHSWQKVGCCDVGAGNGAFVYVANSLGWDCCGYEVNRECSNIDLRSGRWQDVTGLYDVITLHDVLEHLTDPVGCLLHLKSCLREGGTIIVEMPLWEGQGPKWRHLRHKQHVCLYSYDAFLRLAAKCGLKEYAFWRPKRGALDKGVWLLQSNEYSGRSDPKCIDCGVNTVEAGEYYGVRNDVWPKGLTGYLCIGCLEARIGRHLIPLDFTFVSESTCVGPNGSPRLLSRSGGYFNRNTP